MNKRNRAAASDGYKRFAFQLEELNSLLIRIASSESPAFDFYNAGARNIIFNLEALCRIYRIINDKKTFSVWNEEFKLIEDQLGRVDYYDAYMKTFSKNKKLPGKFKKYFYDKRSNELNRLNDLLKDKRWIGSHSDLFERIYADLHDIKWSVRNSERKKIINFFVRQIDKIIDLYEAGELNFKSVENGVHAFRRKIRWISIYAKALNGLIQLEKTPFIHPDLKKYQTSEIIKLSYNKLPVAEKGMVPVYVQAPSFYALSWMIQELGILKDEGLKIIEVNNALNAIGIKDSKTIEEIKKIVFANSKNNLSEIYSRVEIIADDFIYTDRVLYRLKRDFRRNEFKAE